MPVVAKEETTSFTTVLLNDDMCFDLAVFAALEGVLLPRHTWVEQRHMGGRLENFEVLPQPRPFVTRSG